MNIITALATLTGTAVPTLAQPLYTLSGQPEERVLTMPRGERVRYRAYEGIPYVANVVDPEYQTLNFYVPEPAYDDNRSVPIFLKTNVGGYMAARAGAPSPTDATGRALQEGFIVVIPGSRGSNSTVEEPTGGKVYTGPAPAGIVDLKAAVRFLRHNDAVIPGDKERIITDGTSAGGAMSSLLGATGNHPAYEPYLREIGAADVRDDIFAAVCFCPITDLDHADMAYEWLYRTTNSGPRGLDGELAAVSDELAALYPAYLESLALTGPDSRPLTADNYMEYLKTFIISSAQAARNGGADMPADAGIVLNDGGRGRAGEFVVDIVMPDYLAYVARRQELKPPPAFDRLGVAGQEATAENRVFGDSGGNPSGFTDYSLRKSEGNPAAAISDGMRHRVRLMNPMNFIGDPAADTAPHWYIRHGAADRDTAFNVPVNLYTLLLNNGYDADFALAWNRGHTGDYDLDGLFDWIKERLARAGR